MEEEEELEWAVNLESFPLSRGSHEWVAAWSLVSLQEVNSEKKSFLMAHKYQGKSEPVPFFFVFVFLANSSNQEPPQIFQEAEEPNHREMDREGLGGRKETPLMARASQLSSAPVASGQEEN